MAPSARIFIRSASAVLHHHTCICTLAPRSFQRFTAYHRMPIVISRPVASSVSHRPASQTLPHALTNAKEEMGNSAKDLAKTIAGNVGVIVDSEPAGKGTLIDDSFIGITTAIAAKVPQHILTMGLAGTLPYLGTSITTLYLARQAGLAASGLAEGIDPSATLALLNTCMNIQVTYGAVIISFAGALHWGMEFAAYGGHKGYPRLFLGAAPVVFAWSTLALDPFMALVAQWAGYTSLWYCDMRVTGAGWAPNWYSQYRFYLSVLVGTCIVGTLAGTSYFGPSPGHDMTHHTLEQLRAQRREHYGEGGAMEVPGLVEAVPAGEDGDAYIRIRRRKEHEDEGEGENK